MPKTFQNENQNLSKSDLEASWEPFGASWTPLGATGGQLRKTKKINCFEANLGAEMQQKSIKIDVKKKLVLRPNFFPTFFEFSRDLGLKNIVIVHQMLV